VRARLELAPVPPIVVSLRRFFLDGLFVGHIAGNVLFRLMRTCDRFYSADHLGSPFF